MNADAVKVLVSSLNLPHPNLSKIALNSLMEILVTEGEEARENILNNNVVGEILHIINDDISIEHLRDIVGLIRLLCGEDVTPTIFACICPLMLVLIRLLSVNDRQVLFDACCILFFITNVKPGNQYQMEAVADAGAIPELIKVLNSKKEPGVLEPALRTLCNISCGKDRQINAVIQADGLTTLNRLLRHTDQNLVSYAALTIGNIMNRSQKQIQIIFDAGTFHYIRKILEKINGTCQENAVWTVLVVTKRGTPHQIYHLIEHYKILKPFYELIKSKDSNTFERVRACIVNLHGLIEKVGRIANLSLTSEESAVLRLPYQNNEQIYKKSISIIETFFQDVFLCNMFLKLAT